MASIQIIIPNITQDISDILIAMLDELGFSGFEQTETSLLAYSDEKKYDRTAVVNIVEGFGLTFSESVMEQINWNIEWEKSFAPVMIRKQGSEEVLVYVYASFHSPMPEAKYEILINPKMSFGTGHHATTSLMMEEMSSMNMKGKEVFDFGTGTGILSVLAEKMGASKIAANDIDEWSINNAAENIKLNECLIISLAAADKFPDNTTADIILANINLNVILENLPAVSKACRKDTQVLLSGILKSDENQVKAALIENKMRAKKVMQEGEWILIVAELTS